MDRFAFTTPSKKHSKGPGALDMKHFLSATSAVAISLGLLIAMPATTRADVVHVDDTIVQGSLCVGFDCVNGENFGFDTMRLKENNLRIHFDDTSSAASFPSNDWRIVVNDTSNGGASYFSVEDSTAGRTPFRIDAGAPANSLRIDSGGDVGIGVDNPVVPLHVRDGNTPTLRLEQDGSSGFTPQIFDVAANEANFFIRDVTNGSALPFRIQPGADQDTIFLSSDSRVGVGTNSPQVPLDVYSTNGTVGSGSNSATTAGIRIRSQSGPAVLALDAGNDGEGWRLVSLPGDDEFRISKGGSGLVELRLTATGDMFIPGTLTTAGSCAGGCDRVFDDGYNLPSIEDHARFMFDNRYLMHVGPTEESGPFNLSEKVGGMLSELEYAHLYIAQLNEQISEMDARIRAIEEG
jgi:hypothetical protein